MDMVVEAIDNLAEKRGSSVQAIKAYILQNFKTVRVDMIKSMLRRSLTMGLQQGIVARPKGQTDTQVGLRNVREGGKTGHRWTCNGVEIRDGYAWFGDAG